MSEALTRWPALRWSRGRLDAREDLLAGESAIALSYNDRVHAVMMATPLDLEDYALGFALAEGVVEAAGEFDLIDCIRTDAGLCLEARIPQHRFDALIARPSLGNSACGLCGASAVAHWTQAPPALPETRRWPISSIALALEQLQQFQPLNHACGGLHAAAWAGVEGIAFAREDVGRHNALDKLIGALARQTPDPADAAGTSPVEKPSVTTAHHSRGAGPESGFVVMSSRASFELVHKCARAGIGLLVTISAPSSAAVALARQCNLTLIAFARGDSMTVYSGDQRIDADQA